MNIYESITNIMLEGYAITKAKRNVQQGFMYRGIDDVMNAFQPIMAKYHIFCVPEVLEHRREERVSGKGNNLLYSVLRIKYTFYAEDGSSVSAVVVGEGMDSGDKASNKAMAVAMKYAMFQVFCIPTEEMPDPDSETPPPSSPAPKSAKFTCAKCGEELRVYTDSGGKYVSLRKHAEGSRARFGDVYCLSCIEGMADARPAE